jgi:hypothetical protein
VTAASPRSPATFVSSNNVSAMLSSLCSHLSQGRRGFAPRRPASLSKERPELSQPSIFDLPVCKPETLAERAVYDAADRGASLREMYRIYHRLTRDTEPPESPSGQQLQLVKDLLAKRDKGAK